jgi:hypothetical protein
MNSDPPTQIDHSTVYSTLDIFLNTIQIYTQTLSLCIHICKNFLQKHSQIENYSFPSLKPGLDSRWKDTHNNILKDTHNNIFGHYNLRADTYTVNEEADKRYQ